MQIWTPPFDVKISNVTVQWKRQPAWLKMGPLREYREKITGCWGSIFYIPIFWNFSTVFTISQFLGGKKVLFEWPVIYKLSCVNHAINNFKSIVMLNY